MVDAAHYLQVYDADLVFSWTPKEFKNFIKGARLRQIDGYELAAAGAMFNAQAQNSKKRLKLKDLYDADKARKQIDSVDSKQEDALDLTRYRKAQAAMKAYRAQTLKKGGTHGI